MSPKELLCSREVASLPFQPSSPTAKTAVQGEEYTKKLAPSWAAILWEQSITGAWHEIRGEAR
jgi:hypothetical protein